MRSMANVSLRGVLSLPGTSCYAKWLGAVHGQHMLSYTPDGGALVVTTDCELNDLFLMNLTKCVKIFIYEH